MKETKEQKRIREIYWVFRNKVYNEHIQMEIRKGKVIPHKDISDEDDCNCYVCDLLIKLEGDIKKIFGEEKYESTPKV